MDGLCAVPEWHCIFTPKHTSRPMELTITSLSKTYGNGVKALDNVSLHIPTGMFGLLGPNGAGKSTLMRILATLQEADSGSAMLGNIDVLNDKEAVRKVLGYLPQEFGVYPRVSAYEMLDHIALLKGVVDKGPRKELVEALLQRVNLWEHRKRRISGFSGGMKQRFGIAQSLIGDPKLIIVDEPTAGLDPGERNRFYNLLTEIGENVVVILSTHIVQDVQELCNNMAIINKGQLLYAGAPNDALKAMKGKVWEKAIGKQELEQYANNHVLISNKLVAGRPIIHVMSDMAPGDGFISTEPNLEDVFFGSIRNSQATATA
jgi:ABC-2 type transport system ATP-binding protein